MHYVNDVTCKISESCFMGGKVLEPIYRVPVYGGISFELCVLYPPTSAYQGEDKLKHLTYLFQSTYPAPNGKVYLQLENNTSTKFLQRQG